MPTIDDVARLAGVSKMTVSRVLNNSGYVKESTYKRIQQAISDLKYRPNMVARGLVTGRMHTLAHVMLDIDDMIHSGINKGFEEECYKRGYNVLVCDANGKNRESKYINMIIDKKIDGAIFHHLDISEEQVEKMTAAGVKCVLIDNEYEIQNTSNIVTDNYYGGQLAAEHLIKLGHTKIGCLYGVLNRPERTDSEIDYIDTFQFNIWRERTRGFCDALKAHGLEINNDYFYQGDGTMEHGIRLARQTMNRIISMEDRPTAIYCENDVMAMGALNALLKLKLDLPGDMAIVGHDGLSIVDNLYPRLTTVVQPTYQIGKLAAKMLIDLIENESEVSNVKLSPFLRVGEST